jgi:hypothetical protein
MNFQNKNRFDKFVGMRTLKGIILCSEYFDFMSKIISFRIKNKRERDLMKLVCIVSSFESNDIQISQYAYFFLESFRALCMT